MILRARKIYNYAIIFFITLLFSSSNIFAIGQDYEYAGVLPFINDNGNFYAALTKETTVGDISIYSGFYGKKISKDNNKPQNTAARVFSRRTKLKFNEVISLIDKQCHITHCKLRSFNEKFTLFALLVKPEVVKSRKDIKFVELKLLEKAISWANGQNKCDKIFAITQDGTLIILSEKLVEELVSNIRNYNKDASIFQLIVQESV